MKSAIIIGATGGIGRVIAQELFNLGWSLALTSTRLEKLESLFNPLKKADQNRVHFFALDLKNTGDSQLNPMLSALPAPDLIVNTAGIHHAGSLDLSDEKFRELLEINVMGPIRVVKTFTPGMIKKGSGTIINISSRRGRIATPAEGAYSTSKFALNGFGETLYKELSPKGIKVTTLCPGWVHTPMADRAPLEPSDMVQAQDILEAILFVEKLSPAARVKEIVIEPGTNISN